MNKKERKEIKEWKKERKKEKENTWVRERLKSIKLTRWPRSVWRPPSFFHSLWKIRRRRSLAPYNCPSIRVDSSSILKVLLLDNKYRRRWPRSLRIHVLKKSFIEDFLFFFFPIFSFLFIPRCSPINFTAGRLLEFASDIVFIFFFFLFFSRRKVINKIYTKIFNASFDFVRNTYLEQTTLYCLLRQ